MHQLQLVQTVTVVLLIYSVIAGLELQEFGDEAFQAGLAAVAMVMGTANCVFMAFLLFATCIL